MKIFDKETREHTRQFVETKLLERLAQCTEQQQNMFKRMYAYLDHDKFTGLDLDRPMDEVISNIPDEKIDTAMDQVRRTVANNIGDPDETNKG